MSKWVGVDSEVEDEPFLRKKKSAAPIDNDTDDIEEESATSKPAAKKGPIKKLKTVSNENNESHFSRPLNSIS